MNVLTKDVQILETDGQPAFAVVPFKQYQQMCKKIEEHELVLEPDEIPHEVMSMTLSKDYSPAKAWRVYLRKTQKEAAKTLEITQSALSQIENSENLKPETIKKLAITYSISTEQLNW